MSAIQIADNTWAVGVKDPELRRFDIIMETEHGTSYNAYLVKGKEKTALIDTVKAKFTQEYLANVEEIASFDKIDYLIVNHTENDHSGAIPAVLERNPKIELYCSAPALPFLKATINDESVTINHVKDKHELDLGGRKLIFRLTPQMHWPDTMMEYMPDTGILFSCDGFAAHMAEGTYVDDVNGDYDREFHEYYDKIMRYFGSYIRRNLDKLDEHDIAMIAPSHGPIIRQDPDKYLGLYREYAADKTEGKNQISIFYITAYGNTQKLAERFRDDLKAKGYEPVMFDVMDMDENDARDAIESSKAVLYGTPTFNGDAVRPIWDAIELLSTVPSQSKKAAVFGSYGWGGEGIKLVAERLSGMKLKVFEENFKARLVPSDEEGKNLDEYCNRLAEFIG